MEEKKKGFMKDKSSIMTILGMTIAFILIIALSFGTRFFFRPGIDDSFWGDLCVAFAICVYSLYFGIIESRNHHMKKFEGRYQIAYSDFKKIREQVIPRDNEFNQWLEKYYEKQKQDYYIAILSLHGNINPLVLDLDRSELPNLLKPYKKNWDNTEFEGREDTYFRSLNEEQIKIIEEIFDGKVKVERIPDDYFKTIHGQIILNEYVEQARKLKKDRRNYIIMIFSRLVMVFAFAFVFASFGVRIDEATGKEEILNSIIQTISRIWTMITSFTYGFLVGKQMVVNMCETLEYKVRVNKEFLCDKNFKALSENEIAQIEYERSMVLDGNE